MDKIEFKADGQNANYFCNKKCGRFSFVDGRNLPIRDGVFYHIPYNLGTPVFTVYKHADIAEWQAECRPVNS